MSIDKLTKYLQNLIAHSDHEAFLAECPLVNDYVGDVIEVILKGKTDSLPLETVEDVLPAIVMKQFP